MMALEANTTFTKELIKEAAWLYWKKVFFSTFIISLLGVALALLLIFYFNSKDWISGTLLTISIIGSVIFFLAYFIYRNRSLALFQELETPVVKWKFTEENISAESDIGKSEIKWNMLKSIIKSNNVWLLVYKNNSYSTFPLSNVSQEVLDYLSSKIEQN